MRWQASWVDFTRLAAGDLHSGFIAMGFQARVMGLDRASHMNENADLPAIPAL
jgi:hypothetical protein